MTIFFHAGTQKTGTTSLQRFFEANREALAASGFIYPALLGRKTHAILGSYSLKTNPKRVSRVMHGLTSEESVQQFMVALDEDFRRNIDSTSNYIISSEHWGKALDPSDIRRLKALLTSTGQDVKVIMYFRNPIDYLASTYSTDLKHGKPKILTKPKPKVLQLRYNYLNICDAWSSEFGQENIVARIFAREKLFKEDIVTDFLSVLGIDVAKWIEFDFLESELNRSLDYVTASILLEFNEGTLAVNGAGPELNLKDVVRVCEKLSVRERILIPKGLRAWMYDALKDDLALFNQKYLAGDLEWPFPDYNTQGKKPMKRPSDEEKKEFLSEMAADH